MKRTVLPLAVMKKAVLALTIVPSLTSQGLAVDRWLDTNGTGTADSGIANGSTITWSTGTSNWNTASSGSGGAISGWTNTTSDRAFFAAGADTAGLAYTVTMGSAITTGAVFVEEGTVTKTGTGALIVQTFDITNGGFFINSSSSLTVAAGGTTTLNGTGATFGNSNTGSGGSFFGNSTANGNMSIVLNGGGTLSANGGSTGITTILDGAGTISGTGPLVIAGNGTLRMAKANSAVTYTGGTIINGRLQTSTTANSLPSATDVTINSGGEWNIQTNNQLIGSLTGAGNITSSSATPVLTVGGATSPAAYSGNMSGTMALTKSGAGTLTLSGTNTYAGATSVTGGNLRMNSAAAVPSGTALTLGGGTLTNVSGGLKTFTGATTLSANSTLLQNSVTENFTFSGNFTNSGGNRVLTVGNAAGTTGVITLSGNVFLSNTAGTGRTLILAGSGSSSPTFSVSGNVADFNGAGTAGNIQVGNGSNATAATLTLSGTNSHTGATNVSTASLLNIGSAGALGSSTLTTTGTGSFDNTTGSTLTISNNIALSGGSLTFVGTNDLSFGNNTVAMSVANRTITTAAGILTIGGITQDASPRNFTKAGGGTLVLIGNSSYTGNTSINAGTLTAAATGALGGTALVTVNTGGTLLLQNALTDRVNDGATIALSGGTLRMPGTNGESETLGPLTLSGNSTIDFTAAIANTIQFASLSGSTLSVHNWSGTIYPGNATTDPNTDLDQDRFLLASATPETEFPNIKFYSDNGNDFIGFGRVVSFGSGFELVPVPEPTAVFGALALLGLAGYRERRRAAELRRAARRG